MARRPRHIQTGQLYEMVFRAKEGIPLPCTEYMKVLIISRLAKALKEGGISLCHFSFIGNHTHILFVPHCKSRLRNFGAQLKSSLTRAIKKVLGYSPEDALHLWDGRSTIMQILDIDMAVERITYLYCNPVNANLVSKVEDYPGVHSWDAFLAAEHSLDAQVDIQTPSIPEKHIPQLNRHRPSEYYKLLEQHAQGTVSLPVEPHAWIAAFGITDEKEIAEIKRKILSRIKGIEAHLILQRKKKGKTVMPKSRLTTQRPTVSGWIPRKKGRKIFFLSSCKELRFEFIDYFKRFCRTVQELYKEWKQGVFPQEKWPPEAYIPQQP